MKNPTRINWTGDGRRAARLASPFWVIAGMAFVFFFKGRPTGGVMITLLGLAAFFWQPAGTAALDPAAPPATWRSWTLGGGGVLLVNLLLLEWRIPYFFTQDDNLSQFLPVILRATQSLAAGVFPTWNPYQLLGSPTASVGTYALTYPFTHASRGLAALAGNENATLEVFCVLHLVAGYFAMVALGRTANFRPSVAALAALSYVLCGFFLVVGRSWYYVIPTAVWMPLLLLQFLRWAKNPVGTGWVLSTGLVIGLYFHSGNAQFWLYGMMYCGVLAVLAVGIGWVPWPRLSSAAAAALVGGGLALPLAGVQAMETSTTLRWGMGTGVSLFEVFHAMLVPRATEGNLPSISYRGVGPGSHLLYHCSTILAALAVIGVLRLVMHPRRPTVPALCVFIPTWLLALWLCWGDSGGLWTLMARLPVFDGFRLPFKHFAFANLFMLMTGSILLTEWLGRRKFPRRAEAIIMLASTAMLSWHAGQCRTSFWTYDFKPYPPVPASLAGLPGLDGTVRMMSFCRERETPPSFYDKMMLNFPTVAGWPSLTGYDPLVFDAQPCREVRRRMETPGGLAVQLNNWGVRWVLFDQGKDAPTGLPADLVLRTLVLRPDSPGQDDGLRMSELKACAPLAFLEQNPTNGIPVRFDAAGANVALTGEGGRLVVNVLHRKWMRAEVDGQPAPCAPDDGLRCALTVPPGSRTVRVSYRPPWLPFGGAGLLLAAAGIWLQLRVSTVRERRIC